MAVAFPCENRKSEGKRGRAQMVVGTVFTEREERKEQKINEY